MTSEDAIKIIAKAIRDDSTGGERAMAHTALKALEAQNKMLAEALKIAKEGLLDAHNYMLRGGIPPVFSARIEHVHKALAQRIGGDG